MLQQMKLPPHLKFPEKNKNKAFPVLVFIYFLLGITILFIRNPDPFFNPVIYAEDGLWSALALREGWWHALLNSRTDYFVFLNVLFLFLASKISILLTGNALAVLPQAIAVVSFSFFSAIATLAFATVRNISNSLAGGIAFLCILLIPLGTTQNEIIGRILQVGFYMPFTAVLLLYWRNQATSKYKVTAIDFIVVLCAATNPFVLAVCLLYLVFEFFEYKNIKFVFIRSLSLAIPILVLITALIPRLGGKGGIQQDFLADNLIEALIARPILYPFIFPWYGSLSDSISIVGFLTVSAITLLTYIKSKNKNCRFLILFSFVTIISYSLATVVMRPGLTSLLSHYSTTFPDRYFMGVNVLVVFLFIIIGSQTTKFKNLKLFGAAIILTLPGSYLYWNEYIFEWSESKYPFKSNFYFSEQLCMSEPIDGTLNSAIQIYPAPYWKMVVPTKDISKQNCMYRNIKETGLFDETDAFKMQPSVQLNASNKIDIRTTFSSKNQSTTLKRIGILFGTYSIINPGEAELRLKATDGSSFIERFSLPSLGNNQYHYFYPEPKNYTGGEIVSASGGGISSWESNDGKGGIHTCIIYEYVDGRRGFTPGCPL